MNKATKQEYTHTNSDPYQNLVNEYEAFAYVVSHDLAAPIRQLQGLSEILLKDIGSDLSPQQQNYKDMIGRVTIEADKTLDALLVFSRLNTDEKNFKDLDLKELISDVLAKLGAKAKESACTFSIKEMPIVRGDYDLLVRMFYHLIDNAIKFQPEGQNPDIRIAVEQQDGKSVFSITDNGIGIDPEKIETAFIIFRKLNAVGSYKGRGVGLTFAKKIIEIHNGCIWIESTLGQGTKVSFTLGLGAGDS